MHSADLQLMSPTPEGINMSSGAAAGSFLLDEKMPSPREMQHDLTVDVCLGRLGCGVLTAVVSRAGRRDAAGKKGTPGCACLDVSSLKHENRHSK